MTESPDWNALIQQHLDGQTTTEEATALSAGIVANADVRSRYLKAARVHGALADETLALDLDLETEPGHSAALKEQRRMIWQFAWSRQIAAGLVAGLFIGLLVLGGFVWLLARPSFPEPGLARVVRVEGEVLADGKRALAGGDELFPAENVSITKGLIELAFRETGVHVLATAPLSIRLHSTERMFLQRGEMKVVVPPQGVGFVVDTPERKITDLGTSFVVKAGPEGSKVLVLDGQVAVDEPTGGPQHLMFEGEVAEFGQSGMVNRRSRGHPDIPELSWLPPEPAAKSLTGILLGYQDLPDMAREKPGSSRGVIAQQVLPLVRSGFHDRTCLEGLKQERLRFSGIAGTFGSKWRRDSWDRFPRLPTLFDE